MDDGRRRTDNGACLYYKLTYEPKGSGELKIVFSEAIRGMKLKLFRNVHNISLYKNLLPLLMCFRRYGNLNVHSVLIGKVKVGLYFYLTADILTKVLQKCSLNSSLPKFMNFAQTAAFDWLPWQPKG